MLAKRCCGRGAILRDARRTAEDMAAGNCTINEQKRENAEQRSLDEKKSNYHMAARIPQLWTDAEWDHDNAASLCRGQTALAGLEGHYDAIRLLHQSVDIAKWGAVGQPCSEYTRIHEELMSCLV